MLSKLPSNMKMASSVVDPAKIAMIVEALKNSEDGSYTIEGQYHLCFKDLSGQVNCTNIGWDSGNKFVWGTFFIDKKGKLFQALRNAQLIPPYVPYEEPNKP